MSLQLIFKVKVALGCLFLVTFFSSCQEGEKIPDVSHIEADVKIERVDKKIFDGQTKEEILAYLKAHPDLLLKGFKTNDARILDELHKLSTDNYLDTLQMKVDQVYDMEELESNLVDLFRRVKYYYPKFYVPKVYGIVARFEMDLVPSDSLILVGLDYFLGKQSPYSPPIETLPNYIWQRYHPEAVPAHIARELSKHYNQTSATDKTLLSDMIWYGKSYYFMRTVLPQTPDSLLIGYTTKEITDCNAYQEDVWRHFVQNNLFFKTSSIEKRRYLDERPHTSEIGPEAPGRIARWLGWQIVKAYMKQNPELSLQALMQEKDAQKIFERSKYKPQRD